ncbi:hypothetical protein HanHA300_Chr05g0160521 [Helianthus annuus]|nr:hypothetical protein HanHA300_Chr05g0160521 [Helianthus annuus]KAJ0583225.1 hypothetical protein HanHA89_Chr05g0174211 [Helianthus annuus]KAJ0745962.1 hypothetical protein HanOQP8_Chr05g0172131 [Helianthus annuus]KAJ0748962.1 hypothetical protein HanLR1_Chr05g0164391 [Helianthus annuus]
MKEIAYKGVEILDNDNLLSQVDEGVEEYSDEDMDDIRKYRSTYAVTSIFK